MSKGMRGSHQFRTICEVLREINDHHQGDSAIDVLTRQKLRECEDMAKRMSLKLCEYNQAWDKAWWEANPDYAADLKRRLSERYL